MSASASGLIAAIDAPSYISARSANSLISENRPTRIQAEALLVLNRLLDELLLLILSSARSLATDRIKTDGMLKVLNNNPLAKDAVLEAELELRSYLVGKRAEGAKMPLGLLATSRLDGTENFPVNAAYNALRIRCQYYSTLGDREDDDATSDQNIMSSDGRPITTITPGVAIYVTALLEYVGEHILQNIARVVERDNSDEASLYDLRAALAEDELLASLINKMAIKEEVKRRIEILESRRLRRTQGSGLPDELFKRGKTEARSAKPWQVPSEGEFDEAAGTPRFASRRISIQPAPQNKPGSQHERASSSGHKLNGSDPRDGAVASSVNPNSSSHASSIPGSSSNSTAMTSIASSDTATSSAMGRRQSSERGWTGMFGNMKRRNSHSQKPSTDVSSSFGKSLSPADAVVGISDSVLEPEDEFEALVASGQTMKVSLTPNRLRTIEVAKKEAEAKKNARRRPGTLMTSQRDGAASSIRSAIPSPAATIASKMGTTGHDSGSIDHSSSETVNKSGNRPSSRGSLPTSIRSSDRKFTSPPPSSYRSPSPALPNGSQNGHTADSTRSIDDHAENPTNSLTSSQKLHPRESHVERISAQQDMMDFLKSTPPSQTTLTFPNTQIEHSPADSGKKGGGVGNKVRSLFNRKNTNIKDSAANSPPRQSVNSLRNESIPSRDESSGSHSLQQPIGLGVVPNSVSIARKLTSHVPEQSSLDSFENMDDQGQDPSSRNKPTSSSSAGAKPTSDIPANVTGAEIAETAAAIVPTGAVASESVPAAIFAVKEARSSRPPSQSQSIQENRDESSQDAILAPTSAANQVDEPKRTITPPSPAMRARQDELPSRKIPWGYKRHSSSSYNRNEQGDRGGTPNLDRRQSGGHQSSSSHNGGPLQRGYVTSAETQDTTNNGPIDESLVIQRSKSANSPTFSMGRRGSAAQDFVSFSRASGSQARPRYSSETLNVLAELEKAMRSCSTIDDCRSLVMKAIHTDNINGHGLTNGMRLDADALIEDLDEAEKSVGSQDLSASVQAKIASADWAKGHANTRHPPALSETSLDRINQGLVVGWLLGDGTFTTTPPPSSQGSCQAAIPRPIATTNGSDWPLALDSPVSLNEGGIPATGSGLKKSPTSITEYSHLSNSSPKNLSSSAVSLASNYKDASDAISADSP